MASECNSLLPTIGDKPPPAEPSKHHSSYQNAEAAEDEQDCAASDVAWSCSSSAALIMLAVMIVLPLAALVANNHNNSSSNNFPSYSLVESTSSAASLLEDLPIEGKSNKKKKEKKKSKDKAPAAANECESDARYSKHTVKTAYELPFAALFHNNKGQKKFEASSVTIVGNDVYSVCDSSWAISKFDSSLLPFSPNNVQIGTPDRDGDYESGYEAIFHHEGSDLFYVVRESVLHHDHDDDEQEDEKEAEKNGADESHSYHAIIEELALGDTDYTVMSECSCEFEFEGNSKGFEGAVGFSDANGELYIIGLCEGNHCSEARKADAGNGRLVIMKKREGDDVNGGCLWETLRIVKIPKSAYFIDYSAIDIANDGRVAISSQENSQVWLGQVVGIDDGVIDPDAFGFDTSNDDDQTLQFPKSSDCHTIYCNIEGIHWLNNEMLLAVSDKMKGRGKQDYRCFDKDQSIHAFVLP